MTKAAAGADPISTARPRPRPDVPAPPGMSREQLLRRALSAIEVSAADVTCCTHCGGRDLGRWGKSRRDLQRWRCRACERSCTAATGTALARVHSIDKLRAVAEDMLAEMPASCRKLATILGLDRMTVWRWRKLIATIWAAGEVTPETAEADVAASDTVTLRESRKASREWVRHQRDPARHPAPDRLRWIDYRVHDLPLPEPMARYRIEVRLDVRSRHETDARAERAACLKPIDPPHRCAAAYPRGNADAGHRAIRLAEPFRQFMALFRGPATRHLPTYRAWFLARPRNHVAS